MNDTFDLGSIEVADVAKLAIKHPTTGQPTTWVLDIAGPGHPVSEAIQNEAARERLAIEREQTMARVNGRKWKGPDVDPEAENARVFGRIAKRIIGWSRVTMNGEDFPYSAANAVALLREPRFAWVNAQILDFLGEDAAFIRASEKG
jgi:hypothetical protein